MFRINHKNIRMTKGDTVSFHTVIYTTFCNIYDPTENDTITLYVYNSYEDNLNNKKPIISKDFDNRNVVLNPEDTKFLKGGEYYYKAVLIMEDGTRETYAAGKIFIE